MPDEFTQDELGAMLLRDWVYMRDEDWWEGSKGSGSRNLLVDVSIRAQMNSAHVRRVLGALEAAMHDGAVLPWMEATDVV